MVDQSDVNSREQDRELDQKCQPVVILKFSCLRELVSEDKETPTARACMK